MAVATRVMKQPEQLVEQTRELGEEALEALRELVGRRQRKRSPLSWENVLILVAGLILGALVGAAAGYLLAPADGQTTRARLRQRIQEWLGGGPAGEGAGLPADPTRVVTDAPPEVADAATEVTEAAQPVETGR
jgi:hypothetical protein